jgi:PilZ domain
LAENAGFSSMDARREPRFSISGPVKVTLLSRPEHVLDCVLLDVSATGLKLVAPESLAVDEIISIEAEDHLALADTS